MTNLSLHFTETTLTLTALLRPGKKTSHDLAASLRGTAHRLYLPQLQKCLCWNCRSQGEICTACFNSLFCPVLSICPQPQLRTARGQLPMHLLLPTSILLPSRSAATWAKPLGRAQPKVPSRTPDISHVPHALVSQKHGKNSAVF